MAQETRTETERTSEPLTDEEFFTMLVKVGNNEAKMFTAAYLGAHPGAYFSSDYMHQAAVKLQLDGWVPSSPAFYSYFEYSLVPAGFARKNPAGGNFYASTELTEAQGMSLLGVEIPWSVENPDISVQQLFTSANIKSDPYPAQTRYKVLEVLLTATKPLTPRAISEQLDHRYTMHAIGLHAQALDRMGIASYESKYKYYNPNFKLTIRPRKDAELYPDVTKLVNSTISRLYDAGVREIDFQGLLAACIAASDEEIDLVELRKTLVWSKDPKFSFAVHLEPENPEDSSPAKATIELKPEFREPIGDLFAKLEKFKQQPVKPSLIARSRALVNDPHTVSELLNKTAAFSSRIRLHQGESREQIKRRLVGLVVGNMTISQISQVASENGIKRSPNAIERMINEAVGSGLLTKAIVQPDPTKKQRRVVYSPTTEI